MSKAKALTTVAEITLLTHRPTVLTFSHSLLPRGENPFALLPTSHTKRLSLSLTQYKDSKRSLPLLFSCLFKTEPHQQSSTQEEEITIGPARCSTQVAIGDGGPEREQAHGAGPLGLQEDGEGSVCGGGLDHRACGQRTCPLFSCNRCANPSCRQ